MIPTTYTEGGNDMMDKESIFNTLSHEYITIVETGDYERAIERLTGIVKINSLVSYYVNVVKDYDEDDKRIVEMMVRVLQEIYNNAVAISPISDEDYDKLYEINKEINERDIVGATVGNTANKIISTHKYPDLRGTLDKIHFITNDEKKPGEKRKSLMDWNKSIREILDTYGKDIEIEIFPKWDGISGIFECDHNGDPEKVLKRGDTDRNEAEEMTALFKGSTNLKEMSSSHKIDGPFGLKTEIVMTRANYNRLCAKHGDFKSPRSAVSSIVNAKEFKKKDYLEYLTVIPLQIQYFNTGEIFIPSMSYTAFPYIVSTLFDYDHIKESIARLAKLVDTSYGIDIDGVVIRIVDKRLQNLLGRDDNINNYEVAYKLPPEQKKTILKDIEFSVGVLGAITPVARIEPVKLKGNTISNISLGSIDRFEILQLRQGDEVVIKYDVIPYLDKDEQYQPTSGKLFITPTQCPFCNEELVKQPVLRCVNNSCESRIIGKIMNFVTKMSIPNISIGIITTLYKENLLRSIEDLYQLENHGKVITRLNGFGDKSFKNIIEGINSRNEVFDYDLIGSLGIPDIGRRIFKKVLDVYTIDDLIDISTKGKQEPKLSMLTKIAGIKDTTARKIIIGIVMNEELIKFLRHRLVVKRDTRTYTVKVAFTKVRDKDFEKYLDLKDVLVMDSYNKNVDMLIVPDYQTSSSKVDKAIKDGKEIVSIDDAYKMFEYKK